MNMDPPQISRRTLIKQTAVLIVGSSLPIRAAFAKGNPLSSVQATDIRDPQAFVRIDGNNVVTVISKHIEFGQGAYTGMATLIAEELDADWSQIVVEAAPVNMALYGNKVLGGIQGTGGSSAIADAYTAMRMIGATARLMLVQAAAKSWKVAESEITVEKGIIAHPASQRTANFGKFAPVAAHLPIPSPALVKLKPTANFKLIGKGLGTLHRVDSRAKTDGTAQFTQDIHEPNMLTVVIKKNPRFGGIVKSFDATEARKIKGVVDVKQIKSGVAVYALNTWAAIRGREKLVVVWDDSHAEKRSSHELFAEFRSVAQKAGISAAKHGDLDKAFKEADKVITAEYSFPFLAHAPMEPLDGYVFWDGKQANARYGCQIPTLDQPQFCKILGLPPEQVHIETILAGGSFGRRIDLGGSPLGDDLAVDMASAVKALGPGHGVKVVWTREDDIQGGWYRPMILHTFKAAIQGGKITAWSNTVTGQSFVAGTAFNGMMNHGVDPLMVEGSQETPYLFPNFSCDTHIVPTKVSVTSLRSVAGTHAVHAVESFLDELLDETKQDPIKGRLALMDKSSRYVGVLQAVAKAANWNGAGPVNGRARGVGVAKAFNTYVAQIAEVSIGADGIPKVHKVWCAVDCGVVVNPDIVRAQIQGGIAFGLGMALYGQITLDKGIPQQSNFHNYRQLRINEMPEIEVIIVPSTEAPTGVGELGVPTIAPAVGNALARLGRSRKTLSLPFVQALQA